MAAMLRIFLHFYATTLPRGFRLITLAIHDADGRRRENIRMKKASQAARPRAACRQTSSLRASQCFAFGFIPCGARFRLETHALQHAADVMLGFAAPRRSLYGTIEIRMRISGHAQALNTLDDDR